jgi:hypothetical protein
MENLRYLIFEVPQECFGDLSPTSTDRWKGRMGRFRSFSNGVEVNFHFILQLNQPKLREVSWRASVPFWEPGQDLDDIRNGLVAKLYLESDPPFQIRTFS